MPKPFHQISVEQFAELLEKFPFSRRVDSVHMHHTWRHAFVIGAGPIDFIAPISGELVCFANDVPQAYWNNSGQIMFTITALGTTS